MSQLLERQIAEHLDDNQEEVLEEHLVFSSNYEDLGEISDFSKLHEFFEKHDLEKIEGHIRVSGEDMFIANTRLAGEETLLAFAPYIRNTAFVAARDFQNDANNTAAPDFIFAFDASSFTIDRTEYNEDTSKPHRDTGVFYLIGNPPTKVWQGDFYMDRYLESDFRYLSESVEIEYYEQQIEARNMTLHGTPGHLIKLDDTTVHADPYEDKALIGTSRTLIWMQQATDLPATAPENTNWLRVTQL